MYLSWFQSIHGVLQNSTMTLKGGPGGAVIDYFAILKNQELK